MHTLISRLLGRLSPSTSFRGLATCLAIFSLLGLLGASITEAALTIEEVAVGNGTHFRVGHFTQVRVKVQSDQSISDARLELEMPDGEGVTSVLRQSVPSIQSGSNDIEALAKFGRVRGELVVRLLNNDGTVLASKSVSTSALLSTQSLVLSIGADVSVGDAIALRQEQDEQETIHALLTDPSVLPTNWMGYQGVHLVVMAGGPSSLVKQMSDEQLNALDQWTRMGGRLLLSCGSQAETMLSGSGPLARFVPGEFDRVTMQRQTSGVENFVGKTEQSLSSFVGENAVAFKMPMAVLREPRGKALIEEGIGRDRTPLAIRASHGFGHVIFVAADLDDGPISQWKDGRRRLVGKLLDIAIGETQRDDGEQTFSQLTQIGYDDITGQLRAGLDQFAKVKLVPFSWIAVLVGLYVLLIGPGDYFLLRRLKERFGWTWVTFPLVVVAACVLASMLTQYWKGRALHINQVDIVDFDTTTGMTRGTTWAHVFSPASRKYDVSVQPTEELFPIQQPRGGVASWQGLPGDNFGGMNTRRVHADTVAYNMDISVQEASDQKIAMQNLPIDVYASRSLHAVHWGQVELPQMPTLLADSEDLIEGEVLNPLPVDLKESVLYFGRLAYPIGTLPATGSIMVDRFGAKKISSRLTRWKVDMDHKGQSTAWNRKSLDVERILEIMMFHDAAGSSKYTSLLNRYQGEVDFSDHLEQGTALLVGKVKSRTTNLLEKSVTAEKPDSDTSPVKAKKSETTDAQVTFVRVLMPVRLKKNRRSNGT